MPRDRTLLDLDMTPRRPFGIVPKHLRDLVHPPHFQPLREIHPIAVAILRLAHEPAVFGAHPELPNVSEVYLEESLVPPRDDVYDVVGVGRELGECEEGVRGGNCHRGCLHDRCQRALSQAR